MGFRLGHWIRHSATGQWLGARVGAAYIRLVRASTRWQIIGIEHRDAALARQKGAIAVIWHGRLFLSPTWGPPGHRTVAMISNNRDGDLIAAIVNRFTVFAVRGSTYDHEKQRDKGGQQAFHGAYEELIENKAVVAITPDGPRGPRMRAQAGAAALAIATGSPIIPVAFSCRRGKVLRSWDRFFLPWPFGRGVQIYGDVLTPPAGSNPEAVEQFSQEIEAALTAVTVQADALCGRPPVAPGPPLPGQ